MLTLALISIISLSLILALVIIESQFVDGQARVEVWRQK